MSFLDKIMFWKKEPDFGVDLDKDFNFGKEPDFGQQPGFGQQQDFGNTGLGPSAMDVNQNQASQASHYGQPGYGQDSGFGQQGPPQQAQYPGYQDFQPRSAPIIQHVPEIKESQQITYSKDLEVISAKLDAIKAVLESMNARIHNLERMARDQKEKAQHW